MFFSISSPFGGSSQEGSARPAMPVLEVPTPTEPPTPAVPDAPVTPIDPDPGTPGAPESPAPAPTPNEPPTPVVPEPRPGSPEPVHPDSAPMPELEARLVTYIEDTHGLVQHMLSALDSLIETTNDPEVRDTLEHHKEETNRHRERLAERLRAHRATPLMVKDAGQIFVALTSGSVDRPHPRSPAKVLSDGFIAEHLEITSYELLEGVAKDAGDLQTAEVARRNRADKEAMVEKLREVMAGIRS